MVHAVHVYILGTDMRVVNLGLNIQLYWPWFLLYLLSLETHICFPSFQIRESLELAGKFSGV